jgi:predicted transcriptional regulator
MKKNTNQMQFAVVGDDPVEASRAALESVEEALPHLRAKVYRAIALAHAGITCDEIEVKLNMTHQSASARVHELFATGRIVGQGKRKTRSGRPATIWFPARVAP